MRAARDVRKCCHQGPARASGPPAASHVSELLEPERPMMSWINLGEVF